MTNAVGRKLGEGACAEVFEWEDGSKIVKLAKPNTSSAALQREWKHCRSAWECGLPVPEPFGLVSVEGRPGVVFERIYGESILNRFINKTIGPNKRESGLDLLEDHLDARITARLLYQIHTNSASLSSQRTRIRNDISRAPSLTKPEIEALIAHLDQLPVKQQLCHGDPNPGNILLRDDDALIIDWNDASTGNPEADLAEYIIIIQYAVVPPYLPAELNAYLDTIRDSTIRIFLEEYERLSGIGYAEIEPWIAPVAARKLSSDATSEAERLSLLNEIRRRLRNK
ncbi:aminoglycoside phosphotransferase [Paenibacillus albiflavus]|uniref:Aminoglycoside phosphotransferase n=1 Tax=Paenibacillus albiflavus TaxID=2545760 RepID=A0A4R4E3J1_9BACL|nr:aminoglycoside phosphotransferase family protein [Paenibacillus albiflavus]TCZ73230.1 aminoglycoside phosphotransferase [Paenibacillus albiflavus]